MVSYLQQLEQTLKEAKKDYRSKLELLYSQEISQEEHDKSLADYLKLTSKVRQLRNKK